MKHYAGIGSRRTPSAILALMRLAAKKLASEGWTLRSGGAEGADIAFEQGAFDGKALIYLPWPSFNADLRAGGSLHRISAYPTDEAREIAAQFHPAWDKLTAGGQSLMARNTHQILGDECESPVKFVLCWTENASGKGGTGQAIRIAKELGIPVYDLADPVARARIEDWLSNGASA